MCWWWSLSSAMPPVTQQEREIDEKQAQPLTTRRRLSARAWKQKEPSVENCGEDAAHWQVRPFEQLITPASNDASGEMKPRGAWTGKALETHYCRVDGLHRRRKTIVAGAPATDTAARGVGDALRVQEALAVVRCRSPAVRLSRAEGAGPVVRAVDSRAVRARVPCQCWGHTGSPRWRCR